MGLNQTFGRASLIDGIEINDAAFRARPLNGAHMAIAPGQVLGLPGYEGISFAHGRKDLDAGLSRIATAIGELLS